MQHVRVHYQKRYASRTISPAVFSSLVESLDQFAPELKTVSRTIRSRAISREKITDQEGPQSWHVMDTHSLSDMEYLHTELLLVANSTDSCELHIEFQREHVLLTVTDRHTKWGKAVFDEAVYLLANIDIVTGGWTNSVAKSYSILEILQNVLMFIGLDLLVIWLQFHDVGYLYASAGFFISGVIPTVRRLTRFVNMPQKQLITQNAFTNERLLPWFEVAAILAFLWGVLFLGVEIVAMIL